MFFDLNRLDIVGDPFQTLWISTFVFLVPKLRLGECIRKVKMDSDATNVRMLLHTPNEDVGSENKQIYQNIAWYVRHMQDSLSATTHTLYFLWHVLWNRPESECGQTLWHAAFSRSLW